MTTTAPSPQLTGDYDFDTTHSRFGFVARHALVTKVRGSFTEFAGSAHIDGEDPTKSSATLTIQVASVDTSNEQRDGHLRTNDFFDAENYPTITFTTTSIEAVDSENYKVNGDLTIRGVTKPVSVDFEFTGMVKDPWGNDRIGFQGTTVINRTDFGVNFNAALEAGGVLVSEKVTIEIDISAVKRAA